MTPSHQYLTAGSYACYAVVTDGSSHSATSASIPVTVYSPLTVSLAGTPTSGTLPLPVTFTALAQGGDGHYTYSYNYGDGNTGSNSNHTYTTAGTYNAKVTVTDTASHTVTSTNVAITVWAPLTASIASGATTGTTPFLVNFTSTVAGGDSHYSYNWNFGDGTTATTANPAKTYNAAGNYSVTLTVSDTSSHTVVSNTINMTVYAPLTVSASATPTNLTVGDSSTFTAVASGGDGHYSYAWTFGDGSTGTGATANHVYTTYHAGDFTWMAHVTVTDTASHSVTSADIAIVVKPVPPSITYAKKQHSPFRIVLFGTNFQDGCTATINGVPVQVKYKNGGKIKLKDAKSLCPKGVAVTIVVTNPDGGVSAPFQFTR
jgi:PKD repeat protein